MRQQLAYTVTLFKLLAIPFVLFTICRVLFFWLNHNYFAGAPIQAFWSGIRFDASAIVYCFGPFILLYLLPLPFRTHRIYQTIVKVFFHVAIGLTLILNLTDTEYFKFTLKRSTADLLDLIGYGSDFNTLLPTFLTDYWHLPLALVLFWGGAEWAYRKIRIPQVELRGLSFYGSALLFFTIVLAGSVIGARGGLQLKPLNIINAGETVAPQFIPLVLNTPFSMLQTLDKESLEQREYIDPNELDQIYRPVVRLKPKAEASQTNVVVVILEGFSREFIGAMDGPSSYTPFLDSLFAESLIYPNCFANGKKSIEALPAILSGLPTLMNTPFISSPYSTNRTRSLAAVLGEAGYSTSFYHGGTNGTMGFDAFCYASGFREYIGRSEYRNEADFDGNWGIFDEPFLQYFAQELNTKQQPFFSTVFTLSSHHPFTIPEAYQDRFQGGKNPIHKTIQYSDYSLKRFFESIRKEPWYTNTLFVITADHTPNSTEKFYQRLVGDYAVPLAFYAPGQELVGRNERVTQQADILPSVLDHLGIGGDFVCFGQSVFNPYEPGYSVTYRNGIYQLIEDRFALQFDGTNVKALYDWKSDPLLTTDLQEEEPLRKQGMLTKLQAIIQSYNNRLIKNQLDQP